MIKNLINPNGTVIIELEGSGEDQERGFAIIMDGDFSMLDSLSFTKDDTGALDSALHSYFKNLDEVEFCTNDPVGVKEMYPKSKKITSKDFLSAKYDAEFRSESPLGQCFDMVNAIVKKTGTW